MIYFYKGRKASNPVWSVSGVVSFDPIPRVGERVWSPNGVEWEVLDVVRQYDDYMHREGSYMSMVHVFLDELGK